MSMVTGMNSSEMQLKVFSILRHKNKWLTFYDFLQKINQIH